MSGWLRSVRSLLLLLPLVGLLLPGATQARELSPLDAELRVYVALGGDLSELCGADNGSGHGATCLLCLTPAILPGIDGPGLVRGAAVHLLDPAVLHAPAPRRIALGIPPARAPPSALV